MSGGHLAAIRCQFHRQTGGMIQPGDKCLGKSLCHVLHDCYRHLEIHGERGEDGLQKRRASGRCANGDNPDLATRYYRDFLLGGDCRHCFPCPAGEIPSHHLDFGHQLYGFSQLKNRFFMFRVTGRERFGRDHEGSRFHDPEQGGGVLGIHLAGNDDDRSRATGHDGAGRLKPVHTGHIDVHGNYIGFQGPGGMHCLFTVGGNSNHPDLRVVIEDFDQGLLNGF